MHLEPRHDSMHAAAVTVPGISYWHLLLVIYVAPYCTVGKHHACFIAGHCDVVCGAVGGVQDLLDRPADRPDGRLAESSCRFGLIAAARHKSEVQRESDEVSCRCQ